MGKQKKIVNVNEFLPRILTAFFPIWNLPVIIIVWLDHVIGDNAKVTNTPITQ